MILAIVASIFWMNLMIHICNYNCIIKRDFDSYILYLSCRRWAFSCSSQCSSSEFKPSLIMSSSFPLKNTKYSAEMFPQQFSAVVFSNLLSALFSFSCEVSLKKFVSITQMHVLLYLYINHFTSREWFFSRSNYTFYACTYITCFIVQFCQLYAHMTHLLFCI